MDDNVNVSHQLLIDDPNNIGEQIWSIDSHNHRMVLGIYDGRIAIYEFTSAKSVEFVIDLDGHEECIETVIFVRNIEGRVYVLSGSRDKKIILWDLTELFGDEENIEDRKNIEKKSKSEDFIKGEYMGHVGNVMAIVQLYEGRKEKSKIIASASTDTMIRIWNYETMMDLRVLQGHEDYVYSISKLEMNAQFLVSGGGKVWFYSKFNFNLGASWFSKDYSLRLWNWKEGKMIRKYEQIHENSIFCSNSVVVGSEEYLISGSCDSKIIIWFFDKNEVYKILRGHRYSVASILVAGNTLVSCGFDYRTLVWDLENEAVKCDIMRHREIVTCLTFLDNQKEFASCGVDGIVNLYRISDKDENIEISKKDHMERIRFLFDYRSHYELKFLRTLILLSYETFNEELEDNYRTLIKIRSNI